MAPNISPNLQRKSESGDTAAQREQDEGGGSVAADADVGGAPPIAAAAAERRGSSKFVVPDMAEVGTGVHVGAREETKDDATDDDASSKLRTHRRVSWCDERGESLVRNPSNELSSAKINTPAAMAATEASVAGTDAGTVVDAAVPVQGDPQGEG